MPTKQSCNYPTPRNDEEFADIVTEVFNAKPDSSHFEYQRYGRNGQKQDGVDIISTEKRIAIQCKLSKGVKKTTDLDNELKKFKNGTFWKDKNEEQKYRTFIFAVSHEHDTHLQRYADELSTSELSIKVIFWPEIQKDIIGNTEIERVFYPEFCAKEFSDEMSKNDKISMKNIIDNCIGDTNLAQANLFVTENSHIQSSFTSEFISGLAQTTSSSIFFQDTNLEKIKKDIFADIDRFLRKFHEYYINNGNSYQRMKANTGSYLSDREINIKVSDSLVDLVNTIQKNLASLLSATAWLGFTPSQEICKYYEIQYFRR